MIQHRISRAAASVANHRAAPRSKALRGQFTPGTGKLCRTRRLVSRSVPLARLISPSSVCTRANADTSIWPPHCPSPASRRRAARARLYAACHGRFPAAEAASGLQFRISRVVGLVNQLANQAKKRENDARWQQKRHASVASHRSAPCGIALRGPFTPGTDEVCRTRRARKPERAPRPINIPEQRMHTSKC